MKTIITYGTFDMFHIGHLNLLRRLRQMADKVIVGVSTDNFNKIKGKKLLIPYEQRIEIVRAISFVDIAIPEDSWDQKIQDIKKYNAQIFAIGDDWKGKFDYLKQYCRVVYLQRTENVSTTALKRSLKQFLTVSSDDVDHAINTLEALKKEIYIS